VIIDAHVHIFPRIRGRIFDGPVIGREYGRVTVGETSVQVLPPLNPRVVHTASMLLAAMDLVGVDRAVLLQGPFYGYCNSYVGDAVSHSDDRLVGAIAMDPWKGGRRKFAQALLEAPTACAFKLEFSERTGLAGLHPDAMLSDDAVAWLWGELESRNLVLVIDLGHVGGLGYQTEQLRTLAVSHPALRIVVAHLGQPNPSVVRGGEERRVWLEQVSLGNLDNIWFDTASLPNYFTHEHSYRGLDQCLQWAIDSIGPEKIMWGSDMPATLPNATYQQLYEVVAERLEFLDSNSKRSVFGGTALKVFWGSEDSGAS
jgi:predicted TIM-barrel fold metal-dependent hydrolase